MHFHTNISVLQGLGGRGHVIAIGIEYYNLCPVSKAGINKNKVVLLYGRGAENTEDP